MATIVGGERLASRLREIAMRLRSGDKVRVGFLEGSTYPDGTSVPMVAAIQEFGAPKKGIPPRPFFRRMIAAKSGSWTGIIAKQLKVTHYDAELTLNRVGASIAGDLQLSIRDLTSPGLAESTIRAKGFDKPLVDTAVMLNSIQWEVNGDVVGKVKQISAGAARRSPRKRK